MINAKTEDPRHWEKEEVAFEVWKHHASTGGADKDMMIKIATWLLGFSAAIVAFTLRKEGHSDLIVESVLAVCLSIVGLITSLASAAVTLVYGGYANWNWAKADQIAKDYGWWRLAPKPSPIDALGTASRKSRLLDWALKRSNPVSANEELAPVFRYFFYFSVASFFVHLIILTASFCRQIAE